MSLADIKAKLQQNWSTWDTSGDNKLDATDFLSAFDKNKDGQLDSDELQQLAQQLSSQLEYNNSLLEQMRSLEEMQLSAQRELQAKQEALKQAIGIADEMRSELSEAKRKLKITQEIADSMSKQCREARIEANSLKREAENATKGSADSRNMLKELTEERARIQRALSEAESRLQQVQEAAEQDRVDLLHQNDVLRHSHEALSQEAAELRARVIPIEAEKKSLKEHVLTLVRSLEETTARCEEEAKTRAQAEKRIRDLTNATEALKDKHREMQYLVQQANGKAEASQASVRQLEGQVSGLEEQLVLAEKKITALTQQLQQAQREKNALEQELEQLGNELVAHTKARQMDQDRWATRFSNAQTEMARAAAEARAQAEDFANDAQRRAADAVDAQKRVEEKYLSIQKECNDLHVLIQQTQIDQQSALAGWEAQRDELEHTISDLEKRLHGADAEIEHLHGVLIDEREAAHGEHRALKQQLIQRGERYVAMLDTLQGAVRQLKADGAVERDHVREVMAQFSVMKAFCEQIWGKSLPPLEAWKTELTHVFTAYTKKQKALKDIIEDTKDDVRRAQLAKEEERSKTLMLEENVSRLEHEMLGHDQKVKDIENNFTEKIASQKNKIEQLVRERGELEGRIQRLQQSLDAATTQARNLQYSNHTIQTTLGDSTAKHSAAKQEIQAKINQLSAQVKRAATERDNALQAAEELKEKLAAQEADIAAAKAAAEQAKAETARQAKELESYHNKHAQTMQAVGGTAAQYQEQLKQTQELLRVCSLLSKNTAK